MLSRRRSPGSLAPHASLALIAGASLCLAGSAAAAEDLQDADVTSDADVTRAEPVNVLPDAVAARVNPNRVTATTWAGYDSAKRVPLLTLSVDARIVGRLVLVVGGGYTGDMPGTPPALRPQIGLRAQLLEQAKHGIDGGVAVIYRQDLFTTEGGFFQGAIALERREGRLRLLGNVLYGQDGEGDDRDGEARLAAIVETRPGLLIGLDSRYRRALWSTDPNRFIRDRPQYELVAGPTASYARGSWAVMAETGLSTVRTTTTQMGVIALAGVGSWF